MLEPPRELVLPARLAPLEVPLNPLPLRDELCGTLRLPARSPPLVVDGRLAPAPVAPALGRLAPPLPAPVVRADGESPRAVPPNLLAVFWFA
jgi:hypothetical protein